MKYLTLVIFILAASGCSNNSHIKESNTAISYSPYFKINIPTQKLDSAIFFQSDSVSVRFANGSVLSGLIIDQDVENLPPNFNLSEYPEYLLGLKSTEKLAEPYTSLFSNSWEETKRTLKNPEINKTETSNNVIYTACGEESCISFLVNKDKSDHILMLSGSGFNKNDYKELLKGL